MCRKYVFFVKHKNKFFYTVFCGIYRQKYRYIKPIIVCYTVSEKMAGEMKMNLQKVNYQKELDKILENLESGQRVPTLLLHSCCAPCSSYVLEYLSRYFRITVFYYNPNIYPESEYAKRTKEQQKLIRDMKFEHPVSYQEGRYERKEFFEIARGLEEAREGGARCMKCYALRLEETARAAKAGGFDYFTTTLSISPMKNAQKLNEIGIRTGDEYGVKYLVSDFKKKNGYKRSTELSKEYGLYRQDYCGCEFSLRERQKKEKDG